MTFFSDAISSAFGYPTSGQVKQAHDALVRQHEFYIGQVRTLRNVTLVVAVGGVLVQSPIVVIGGIACAAISQMLDWQLQNRLIAVKSNPNYVHPGANLPYTRKVAIE